MENITELKIKTPGEMSDLLCILANNGYEVKVKTEYDSAKEFKARTKRFTHPVSPCIESYTVTIIGKNDMSEYVTQD